MRKRLTIVLMFTSMVSQANDARLFLDKLTELEKYLSDARREISFDRSQSQELKDSIINYEKVRAEIYDVLDSPDNIPPRQLADMTRLLGAKEERMNKNVYEKINNPREPCIALGIKVIPRCLRVWGEYGLYTLIEKHIDKMDRQDALTLLDTAISNKKDKIVITVLDKLKSKLQKADLILSYYKRICNKKMEKPFMFHKYRSNPPPLFMHLSEDNYSELKN
ncbi:MAG: hypothetical protein AAF203_07175, partial [Pseudomonadota bacterium]